VRREVEVASSRASETDRRELATSLRMPRCAALTEALEALSVIASRIGGLADRGKAV